MNIIRFLTTVILIAMFSSKLMANPNCFLSQENERLTNYCLLESTKDKLINENTMKIVVGRLQKEGYFGGLAGPEIKGSIILMYIIQII